MTMKTLALLLAFAATASAQQVGPTASILATNTTRHVISLQVTTTTVTRHFAAPVVWQGKTNWLGNDVVVSTHSVTNAVTRPGRP